MNKFNLAPREKNILHITIFIVVAAAIFNFIISPFFDKVTGINNEIAKKEYMFKKYQYFQAKSRQLNFSANSYINLTKSLTEDEAAAEIFAVVSEAAKKFTLNIQKIRPLPAGNGRLSKQAVLEVDITGRFSSIFNFISAVEDSPLFMRVHTFHLLPSGNSDNSINCTVAFSRVLF